jgi:hypothetical protein
MLATYQVDYSVDPSGKQQYPMRSQWEKSAKIKIKTEGNKEYS